MQKIKKIAKIAGGVFSWCDARGNDDEPPVIPIGANVMLEISLREAATSGMTDYLPKYDASELAADSYSFALDGDYDHLTDPKMLMLSGVSVEEVADVSFVGGINTYLRAIIPNTNYAGLKAAVEANESIELEGEIAGHDANGVSTFVFNFPVIIRNRVWFPDDAPESVVADPDYLNSAQVQAYIAAQVEAQVAAATAELNGADGTSSYIYVAYASDAAGTGFNLTPSASLPYMAIITSATELAPPVAADFAAATWTRFIGADGQPGTTTVTGLTLTPRGNWATGTTYALNDAVRHANALWQSLADDNAGNEPADDSEFWQLLVADGADGTPANAPLFAYNTVSTAMDEGWHSTLAADDVYFRVSLDGGVTWSIAKQLTASQTVVVQYNVDAVTAWNDLVKPAGMAYSVATGAYFRVRFTGGIYGDSAAIEAGIASQEMRVQFSATGVIGNPLDWHAEPQEGDRYVRFFNESGSVQQSFAIDTGGLEIEAVQLSPLAAPWHTTFTAGDFFMRISTDSGTTFTDAIKIVPDDTPVRVQWSLNGIDYGDDSTGAVWQRWSVDGGVTWSAGTQISGAYAIWLAQGNEGTEQDFLDSLRGHITTVEAAISSFVADSGDDDDDATTAYKLALPGYIVGIRAYADDAATVPDRYDTKITYDADADESTVWLSEDEHDYFAALTGGKALFYIDTAEAMTSGGAFPLRTVTALPATPIAGQMIRLTSADDAAKAAPGVYMHDGVGWTCISYSAAYDLGNLGATPSLTLIPGAAYTATVDAEITTFTVAFTRPGLASITLTNASEHAIAQPEMDGRTSKLLAEGAWDGAATALSKALLEDDGVYLVVSAGGLA